MKLLRVGQKGKEKPAVLDKDGKIRDISSHVKDLDPHHLNFNTISKLQSTDLSSLPEVSSSERNDFFDTRSHITSLDISSSDSQVEYGQDLFTERFERIKGESGFKKVIDNGDSSPACKGISDDFKSRDYLLFKESNFNAVLYGLGILDKNSIKYTTKIVAYSFIILLKGIFYAIFIFTCDKSTCYIFTN